jgi:hypothetical protein
VHSRLGEVVAAVRGKAERYEDRDEGARLDAARTLLGLAVLVKQPAMSNERCIPRRVD